MMVWKVCQLARPSSAFAVAFSILPAAMVSPLRISLETEMGCTGAAEVEARMFGGLVVEEVVVVVRLKVRERRKMMKRAPRMVERARLLSGMGELVGAMLAERGDPCGGGRREVRGEEDDEGERRSKE